MTFPFQNVSHTSLQKQKLEKIRSKNLQWKRTPCLKNNSAFIFSHSKPIWNTKKQVESLPHILSVLLHLMANVRKRKKMELTACKLTHEQGLGGAPWLRQRQSPPITCRLSREVLSLPWCVARRASAAKTCFCSSCLLGRLNLFDSFRAVQHKPSCSLTFVETQNDGKEGKE